MAALYVKQSNASDKVYYPCTDHLGSIIKLVDANGTESFKATYDAWGQQTITTNTLNFHRGYTGHEHLSQFALINMNGRMYDPLLGRFLSPDPFVQLPDFSQNFNRYSYCLNNPLVYVDPDGEWAWIVGAAFIGGILNSISHKDAILNEGVGAFIKYFSVGAVSGAAAAIVGPAVASSIGIGGVLGGTISGFYAGAVSGFINGGANALVSGGGWSSFWKGATNSAIMGGFSGAALGGIFGGIDAFKSGNNVWTGKEIAAGRNAFSLKNEPIPTAIRHKPTASTFDAMPMQASIDEGMTQVGQTPMTPYQKGEIGVERAMSEFKNQGGVVYQTEVSVKVDGIMNRFDFVGEYNGKLHLFEIKNGIYAKPTINQQINLPKLMINKSNFIPIGGNAKYINFPGWKVNQPYKGDYIVIYKHFF